MVLRGWTRTSDLLLCMVIIHKRSLPTKISGRHKLLYRLSYTKQIQIRQPDNIIMEDNHVSAFVADKKKKHVPAAIF